MSEVERMDRATATKLVSDSILGGELSIEQCAALAGAVKIRPVPPGECLIEEGASDDSLHVVLQGAVEVVVRSHVSPTAPTRAREAALPRERRRPRPRGRPL